MITIPTIQQLYNDIKQNLETEFGSTIPAFGKNFLRALAMVQAAKLKMFYLGLGSLQKNMAPDTADTEASGGTLERYGRLKLARDPFPATAGEYNVTVTGTIASTIASNTTFKSNDDSAHPGKMFILDTPHVMVTVADTIRLRALVAGTGSQLNIGDQLSATVPIAGVSKVTTVTSEEVTPTEAETTEEYREKVERSYQLEAQGGAVGDFRMWADDVAGVLRVYPYAKPAAPGDINVYVESSIADSTDGFGTPSAGMITNVEAVFELDPDTTKPINERGRRPIGIKNIFVLPVTIRTIAITIPGFEDLTAEKQTAILSAVTSRIQDIRPYIAGADTLEGKDDILNTNIIVAEILKIYPAAIFDTVTMTLDGVAITSTTFTNGDIPNLTSITYP
jgi:uncharacterized phage protein gp47/JayE